MRGFTSQRFAKKLVKLKLDTSKRKKKKKAKSDQEFGELIKLNPKARKKAPFSRLGS